MLARNLWLSLGATASGGLDDQPRWWRGRLGCMPIAVTRAQHSVGVKSGGRVTSTWPSDAQWRGSRTQPDKLRVTLVASRPVLVADCIEATGRACCVPAREKKLAPDRSCVVKAPSTLGTFLTHASRWGHVGPGYRVSTGSCCPGPWAAGAGPGPRGDG